MSNPIDWRLADLDERLFMPREPAGCLTLGYYKQRTKRSRYPAASLSRHLLE